MYSFMKPVRWLLIAILLSASLFAQNSTRYAGQVIDGDTGKGLPGASIVLQSSRNRTSNQIIGTTSDEDGVFLLELQSLLPDSIEIIYLGYETLLAEIFPDREEDRVFQLTSILIEIIEETTFGQRNLEKESSQSLTVLNEKELERIRGQTLAEGLKEVAGVTVLQTGPAVSKPVIRGLHSQRITIMNAGVAQEGQQWGGDHGPAIDPFAPAQIEVLRGPATVQYGSNAIGGVIKLSPKRLRSSYGVAGKFNLNGFSNNRQGAASLLIEGRTERFNGLSWRMQGSSRRAGDAQTPGYVLNNTGFAEFSGAATVGFQRESGSVRAYYSHFNTDLGIFRGAHIGTLNDLERALERGEPARLNSFSYEIDAPKQSISHRLLSVFAGQRIGHLGMLEMQYGWQQNHRQEFDAHSRFSSEPPKEAAFDLELTTYSGDLTFRHTPANNFFGSFGVSFSRQGNARQSSGSLIPNFRAYNAAVFALEKWTTGNLTLEAGARYQYRWQKAFVERVGAVTEDTNTYQNLSGAVGLNYQLGAGWSLGTNIGTAWRPPGINELYSQGLHHGSAQCEFGNENLTSESSLSADISVRHEGERIQLSVSAYNNSITDFIYLQPRENLCVTIRGAFPGFDYAQANARLRGFEGEFFFHPTLTYQVGLRGSFLLADNLDADEPLIYMPANRMRLMHEFHLPTALGLDELFLSYQTDFVARQDRFPAGQDIVDPPDGYVLHNLEFGAEMPIGNTTPRFSISVRNILDASYRSYQSRYRYFADDPGRDIVLRVAIPFGQEE
ncbi:MAG: TonB-dependent receptor [Calditrichia bacterium]